MRLDFLVSVKALRNASTKMTIALADVHSVDSDQIETYDCIVGCVDNVESIQVYGHEHVRITSGASRIICPYSMPEMESIIAQARMMGDSFRLEAHIANGNKILADINENLMNVDDSVADVYKLMKIIAIGASCVTGIFIIIAFFALLILR